MSAAYKTTAVTKYLYFDYDGCRVRPYLICEKWLTPFQTLDHKCHIRCSSSICEFFLSPDVEVAC